MADAGAPEWRPVCNLAQRHPIPTHRSRDWAGPCGSPAGPASQRGDGGNCRLVAAPIMC